MDCCLTAPSQCLNQCCSNINKVWSVTSGISLCMRPANERRYYIVTSPLIGWAHTQNKSGVNAEIPSATYPVDQYMARHGRTVKQSYCETVYVMILFNFSSRVPIPHWLCILHVHWCRDCETVPEQHWNKPGTVSQSQCTPPQFKQIIFGIKNESEVQGQSSSEFTGILTMLKCICGPNLEILTWIGDE